MRIGLVSDTHIPEATPILWPQVFDAFEGVDCIFHGGDVHEFGLLDQFEEIAPVYCARGNGEDGSGGRPVQPQDERVKYVWMHEFEGLRIGLTHYIPVDQSTPEDYSMQLWVDRYFDGVSPDVIVFGDTHVEVVRRIDGILCVNPGSPTYPHNYDTQYGTIGFLELSDRRAEASVWLITDEGIIPFDWDAVPPWRLRR
ncbi:MAG: YfcE family phosphodiesterase [Gammaproteobacteria bacterium]|nr:YfcE family phosphodiesterase [Gammaproteobacteria bacterium]